MLGQNRQLHLSAVRVRKQWQLRSHSLSNRFIRSESASPSEDVSPFDATSLPLRPTISQCPTERRNELPFRPTKVLGFCQNLTVPKFTRQMFKTWITTVIRYPNHEFF